MKNKTKKKTSGSACVWSGDSEGNVIIWKGESRFKSFSVKTAVQAMCITNPGNGGLHMWIGTMGAVDVYDTETYKLVQDLKFNSGVSGMTVANNHIWIASRTGITVYDYKTFKEVDIPTILRQVHLFSIVTVLPDKEEDVNNMQIWGGSDKCIYVFSAHTQALIHKLEIHTDRVTTLLPIEEEFQVWSGSKDKSICRWHYHTE